MQKLSISVNTPVAVMKDGKPVVEIKREIVSAVVASTKSQNNLIEEMKEQGKNVGTVKVEEIFLDKQATATAVAEMVAKQIKEEEIAKAVVSHIVKALDGACVFKKPPVVRKK